MYGLDKTENVAFLLGKAITQVCIGQYQLILYLEEDISITIEGAFEYDGKDNLMNDKTLPYAASALVHTIGKVIEGVKIMDSGILVLDFKEGGRLRLIDSNEMAESYQITGPNFDIIV